MVQESVRFVDVDLLKWCPAHAVIAYESVIVKTKNSRSRSFMYSKYMFGYTVASRKITTAVRTGTVVKRISW